MLSWISMLGRKICNNALTRSRGFEPSIYFLPANKRKSVFALPAETRRNGRNGLIKVPDPKKVEIGEVFIKGGFPGHAVLVVDVAEDSSGSRIFLLAQSYMPAQDIHILKNPASTMSPWYSADDPGDLITPEWTFSRNSLKRFSDDGCPTFR